MKKTFAIFALVLAVLCLAGCGKKGEKERILYVEFPVAESIVVAIPEEFPTSKELDKIDDFVRNYNSSHWVLKDITGEVIANTEKNHADFISALSKKGIIFLDRTQIEAVMKEHKFQASSLSSDAKTAELGKFLNADFIYDLTSTYEYRTNYNIFAPITSYVRDTTFSFMDINTLEKIYFIEDVPVKRTKGKVAAKSWDISQLYKFKKRNFEGTWYFDSLKSAKVQKDLVCPFAKGYSMEIERDSDKLAKYVPTNLTTLEIGNSEFTLNGKTQGEVSFVRAEENIVQIDEKIYTDAHCGNITFRIDHKTFLKGEVYRYSDQLAILVGQEKDVYYFLMFNK